jgi:hypothetical protein
MRSDQMGKQSEVPLSKPTGPNDPGPEGGICSEPPQEPVLCLHCGRTASNGISCQGSCVADSGY